MKLSDLFIGALTLRTETFTTLRDRSDVFLRGFLVLLVAGLIAGAFAALSASLDTFFPPTDKEEFLSRVLAGFAGSYFGPPEIKAMIEAYVREGASMAFELMNLPPQGGEWARQVSGLLEWIGGTLAYPFSAGMVGWLLFAGLLFHLTARWLGGRAGMAQMLGLTSLAAAPQAFTAIAILLALLAERGGGGALAMLSSLLGLIVAIWSAVIYVKAMSIAQYMTIGRALGAIAIGVGVLVIVAIVAAILVGAVIGAVVSAVIAAL